MRFALSLVTVLALALTGCAGNGTDTTDTTSGPTSGPTSSSSEPAAEPTEPAPTSADSTTAPHDTDDTDDTDDGTPSDGDDVAAAGDCSAAGLPAEGDLAMLGPEARATAAFLLDAAVRCDEQLLFTAAEESDTAFLFGNATFDDVLGLPEDPGRDPAPWEALASLLGGTTPVEADGIWTWPAASASHTGDAAWQELVDSGLYSQAQVDELRAAPDGYLGWRLGIETSGDWLFFTAGD